MASHTVIIGGGIAGLSCAVGLASRGAAVRVVERHAAVFQEASKKNAAVLRHAEESGLVVSLVKESAALLDELAQSARWRIKTGAIYLAQRRESLTSMARALAENDVAHRFLTRDEARKLAPLLRDDESAASFAALFVDDDGVIDIDVVRDALLERLDSLGVNIDTEFDVAAFTKTSNGHRVAAVDGRSVDAARLVIATGAAMRALLPAARVTPFRRHIVEFPTETRFATHPVLWRFDDEVYFRPGGKTALASPCDEAAAPTLDDAVRPAVAARVGEKLRSLVDGLPPPSSSWACLRTWSHDRTPFLGAVPNVPGVFVVGGFGGIGMSAGVALGAHMARFMYGDVVDPRLASTRPGIFDAN